MNKLNELLSKMISKLNISVKAEEQNFTEEQKTQIRENIGINTLQSQADYIQNDLNAPDYIKNRPFYTEKRLKIIEIDRSVEPKAVIKFADGNAWLIHASDEVMDITKEDLYGFSLNGEERTPSGNNFDWSALSVTKSKLYNGIPCTIIGIAEQPTLNFAVILDKDVTIGEEIYPHGTYFLNVGAGTLDHFHVDWIKFYEEVVHKLDPKYYERLAWEENEVIWELTDTLEEWLLGSEQPIDIKEGAEYIVEIDDVSYKSKAYIYTFEEEGISVNVIGDVTFVGVETESTGEPFLIYSLPGVGSGILFIDKISGDVLSGEHSIRVTANGIHKIDPKYLPKMNINADWTENKFYSDEYIKNRPFYNGVLKVNPLECLSEGAPIAGLEGLSFVKIADYFMPDNSILNTYINYGNESMPLANGCDFHKYENGDYWAVDEADGLIYLVGFSKESIEKQNELVELLNVTVPGVYSCYEFNGTPLPITVHMPICKYIGSESVSLKYDELKDIPFGNIPEKAIHFHTDYRADGNLTKNGGISFYRMYSYIEPEVGWTLIMSDGSRIVLSKENLMISKSSRGLDVFEVKDLIVFSSASPLEKPNVDGFTSTGDIINIPSGWYGSGTYVNLDTPDGVYVTGIVVEDAYTKQLDTKFIPPELPVVTASDSGKFLRVSAEGKWVAQIVLNAEEVAF